MTKEQFESGLKEIEERKISIAKLCKQNNLNPADFYSMKWKNKSKEVKVSKAIIPVDVDNEVVTFKINDVVFSIEKKNEKLIELIVRTSLNV